MTSSRDPFRWSREHPLAADSLLAAVVLVAAVVSAVTAEIGPLGWVLIVGMVAPLAVRRRHPVPVLWVIVACTMPFWILDYPDDSGAISDTIALYTVAAYVPRPRSIWHGAAASAVIVTVVIIGVIAPEEDLPPQSIAVLAAAVLGVWLLGDNVQTRRAYFRELEEKATLTEAQRRSDAERAVAEERTRIARELHDVVAHSMSVMVVQAGAGRSVLPGDPDRATDAFAAIESTGRESLSEMRRILGVLRDDHQHASRAPSPGVSDLPELAEQYVAAGLHVDLAIDGAVGDLARGVQLTIYRVVQESLTNTLKHAGPATANVVVGLSGGMVDLVVTDDGRGAAAPGGRGGQGLVGMRERIQAFGGHFEVGPAPGGGFGVHATIPVDVAPMSGSGER